MDEAIRRAQDGDREAFHELYLAHHAPLYRFCLSELRDPEEAKEAVQETFVRAWQAIAGFRGEAAFLGWLFRIARNLIIDTRRARARHAEVSLDETFPDDPDTSRGDRLAGPGPGPEALSVEAEDRRRFRAALAALPAIQRAVFLLREREGMDYREIAVRLELAEGTVKSRLARARDALAAALLTEGAAT